MLIGHGMSNCFAHLDIAHNRVSTLAAVLRRQQFLIRYLGSTPSQNCQAKMNVVEADSLSIIRKITPKLDLLRHKGQAVDTMKAGTTVILRNAKIDMFKNTMRLAVDKWGCIEVTEPARFTVIEENNVSLVEYELVNVTEEAP